VSGKPDDVSGIPYIDFLAAASCLGAHPETRWRYNAHKALTYLMRIGIIMKPASASFKLTAKKATNITLSMDVYEAAKSLGINISQVCEQGLREVIQLRKEQQWNEEHAAFLLAYNRRVEEEGLALDEWRSF
jgi:antitoxin CcdA